MPPLIPTPETPGTKSTTWAAGDGKEDEGVHAELYMTWPSHYHTSKQQRDDSLWDIPALGLLQLQYSA